MKKTCPTCEGSKVEVIEVDASHGRSIPCRNCNATGQVERRRFTADEVIAMLRSLPLATGQILHLPTNADEDIEDRVRAENFPFFVTIRRNTDGEVRVTKIPSAKSREMN